MHEQKHSRGAERVAQGQEQAGGRPSDGGRSALRGMDFASQQAALSPFTAVQAYGGAVGGDAVQEAARQGVSGSGHALPFGDRIQQAFGHHDVSDVRAHTGSAAAGAARDIGARAYATGSDVAFAGAPDLHTVAHEAAHVVQQRGGVQLKGGVGASGDVYERHADAVADTVVRGESAAPLLDAAPGGGGGAGGGAVQRSEVDDPYAELDPLKEADDANLSKFPGKTERKRDLDNEEGVSASNYEDPAADELHNTYGIELPDGSRAYRVGTGSRVILVLPAGESGKLVSTDFDRCGATVMKGEGPKGETILMLGHVTADDDAGHLARLAEDAKEMRAKGASKLQVQVHVHADQADALGEQKKIKEAIGGDVDLQVIKRAPEGDAYTHLVVTPEGTTELTGDHRKGKGDKPLARQQHGFGGDADAAKAPSEAPGDAPDAPAGKPAVAVAPVVDVGGDEGPVVVKSADEPAQDAKPAKPASQSEPAEAEGSKKQPPSSGSDAAEPDGTSKPASVDADTSDKPAAEADAADKPAAEADAPDKAAAAEADAPDKPAAAEADGPAKPAQGADAEGPASQPKPSQPEGAGAGAAKPPQPGQGGPDGAGPARKAPVAPPVAPAPPSGGTPAPARKPAEPSVSVKSETPDVPDAAKRPPEVPIDADNEPVKATPKDADGPTKATSGDAGDAAAAKPADAEGSTAPKPSDSGDADTDAAKPKPAADGADADPQAAKPNKSGPQKGGHLVDGGDGKDKPSNHSTEIDLSNLSKGKIDVAHSFNLASISQRFPILGVAGGGGSGGGGAGVFLDLGAQAALKANASVEIPPDGSPWSTTVDAGIGASGYAAVKGGIEVEAGPVKAEATVAGTASINANAKVGLKVQGQGKSWEVAGRATGIEADLSAQVGVAATLQAGVGTLSAGHTWNLAGPYVLPILHASYPIEGQGVFTVSQQVKQLPSKIGAGLANAKSAILAAAKEQADSAADAITGLDEEMARDDAQRDAADLGNDVGRSNWRTIKNNNGVPRLLRFMTRAEVKELNDLGDGYIKTFEWHKANEEAGLDTGWWEKCEGYKASAKTLMDKVKARLHAAQKAAQQKNDALAAAKGRLRTSIGALASAHSALSYQAKTAFDRGVSRATLHPHFDPHNNAYMPFYNKANGKLSSAKDAAECDAVRGEADAFTQRMRQASLTIRGL